MKIVESNIYTKNGGRMFPQEDQEREPERDDALIKIVTLQIQSFFFHELFLSFSKKEKKIQNSFLDFDYFLVCLR